ncbi:MAG: gfo/Idh/MocA family oxidoreductase, partial [Chloroflexota bacterium]
MQANLSFHMPFDPEHRLFNKALGGGALLDVGVYPLTIAAMLLGMPDAIESHALIGESGVDEQVSMLLKYESGASAILHTGINGNLTNHAVIKGTTGTLTIHEPFWHPESYTVRQYGSEDAETIEIPYDGFGYADEARAVHGQLRAGAIEHPRMSHQMTRDMMQLCDELRRSWGLVYP